MLHYPYKIFNRKEDYMMFFVSDIFTSAPEQFSTPLQKTVYGTLAALHIPFARVETDEAITMGDCIQINAKLDMKMVNFMTVEV